MALNALEQAKRQFDQLIKSGGQIAQSAARSFKPQFNPIPSALTPMSIGPISFGNFPPPQPLKFNLPKSISNPATDFFKDLGLGIINSPVNYQIGNQGLNQNVKDFAQGKKVRPQDVASNFGKTLDLPLNLLGGGAGGTLTKSIAEQGFKELGKQGLKQALKEGVITGGKFGAGFGLSQGLQSGVNIDDTVDYARNLAENVLTSTLGGAALGGTLGAGTYGFNKIAEKISRQIKIETAKAFKEGLVNLYPQEKAVPWVAPIKKALNISNDTVKGLNAAISKIGQDMGDTFANNNLTNNTKKYLPQFARLDTRQQAKIWSDILDLKEGNLPLRPHPAIQQTIGNVQRDLTTSGRINWGAKIGKEEPAKPIDLADDVNSVSTGRERLSELLNYPKDLAARGYSPKQIDKIGINEYRNIVKNDTPGWQHETYMTQVEGRNPEEFARNLDSRFGSGQRTNEGGLKQPKKQQSVEQKLQKLVIDPAKSSKGIISPSDKDSQNFAQARTLIGNEGKGGFSGLDDEVKNAFQGWVNKRRASKLEGYIKSKEYKELDNKGVEGLLEFQSNEKSGKFADLKNFLDTKRKEVIDKTGEDFGYKHDYLPQLWDNTPEEIQQALGRRLSQKSSFMLESVIKDYKEGIALGLKPRYKTLGQLAGWYEERANKLLADHDFFDYLGKNGFIQATNKAPLDWVSLDPDRFPKINLNVEGERYSGVYKAPPELAKVVNNYLKDPQFDLLNSVANYVSRVKNVALNFGIPKTAINAHGVNILARHTLMGSGSNPLSRFLVGTKYMINPSTAQKELDTVLSRAPSAVKNGLTMSAEDYLGFGKQAENLAGQFSKKWEDAFGTPLFNKMLPALKLSSYEQLVKKGMDGKDAAKLVNNVYGGINWEQMGRNKDVQNLLRSMILAPDWAETTVRLGGNFIKALNPLHHSSTANTYRMMMATILSSYVGVNVSNKLSSGHYAYENDPGHTFEVEIGTTTDGQKRYFRPYGTALDMIRLPADIASGFAKGDLSSIFRTIRNRLSIPAGVAIGALTDTDYRGNTIGYKGKDRFGNEMPLEQRAANIGSEALSLVGFPSFIRQGLSSATGQQGIEQGLTQGLELPFRYSGFGGTKEERQVNEINKEHKESTAKTTEIATKYATQLKSAKTPAEKGALIKSWIKDGTFTQSVQDKMVEIAKEAKVQGKFSKAIVSITTNAGKAKFIKMYLKDKSAAEKKAAIIELVKSGLLTDGLQKEMLKK